MEKGENRVTILWLSIALTLLPIAYFYKSLLAVIVDIPYADDYAILRFLNVFTQTKGFGSRLVYLLTAQHNEYKLIFENVIVVAQYYVIGHANFAALIVIGSIFILLTFLLIFRMFYRSGADIAIAAGLFVPCAYLLFQLQYASALDWALTSLQYMPAIFFALLTIWLLSLDAMPMFYAGCISVGLSIASSGNGFFVIPVGVLLLLQNKRYSRVFLWAIVTIACTAVYFWRYGFHASSSGGGAVMHGIHLANLLYTLSFLGASGAGASSTTPSIVLGTMLIGVFFYCVWKRYYRTNPAIFYSMLFILITAFGVACLRSDYGLIQSLASRYRMFSNLYLIFAYLFAVDIVVSYAHFPEALKLTSLGTAFLLTVAFAFMSNKVGQIFLHERTTSLVREMTDWEHPQCASTSEDTNGLGPISSVIQRHRELNLYRPEVAPLKRAIELGIYTPPVLLPLQTQPCF